MYKNIYLLKNWILTLNPGKRKFIKIGLDGIAILLSYMLSFQVRFEWAVPSGQWETMWISLPFLLVASIVVLNYFSKAYAEFWIYLGFRELKKLFLTHTGIVLAIFIVDELLLPIHIPRSIIIIYWLFGIVSMLGIRILCRYLLEMEISSREFRKRLLLVGAGDAGEMLTSNMPAEMKHHYDIIGFIDDDPEKRKRSIHGLPVLGTTIELKSIVKQKQIDEVIIAVPSATSVQMQRIVKMCEESGVHFRTTPGPKELINGTVTYTRVRPVRIDDLLCREEHILNSKKVKTLLQGKSVLVTGAAGSIGSELCRQILQFDPKSLVAVDNNESGLFYLEDELKDIGPMHAIVADVKRENKLRQIFRQHHPQIVFHAAAYKHVPCMERSPDEAILNNVLSTMAVVQASIRSDVENFVQISTDKAVYPNNIMGVSKRICELYVKYMSEMYKKNLISVRFGNVIGSQGSVFTLFEKRIKEGRPIMITHPDVERYFMSIIEACQLVLEAAADAISGNLYVLDMGEPMRVIDLAKHMIALSGLKPVEDIPIRISGLRAGEKMKEVLWYDNEQPLRTSNSKIFMSENGWSPDQDFETKIERIIHNAKHMKRDEMLEEIREIIPEYSPNGVVKNGVEVEG